MTVEKEKNPPSALEDHIGYWLRALSNAVSGSFAARVEKHGVSVAQWVVLRTLHGRDPMTLVEAAAAVGVDKSSFSRMTERLLEKGLIARSPNPDDSRSFYLSLSAAGKKLVPLLAREADKNDKEFFSALSEQEKKRFLATIKSLLPPDVSNNKPLK